MAYEIVMPKAGMAMESGTIIKWLKEIGDKIEYGEPVLEIETDKTSMEVEAMNDGYLISKLYEAGTEVPVVTTIGYIGEKGEKAPQAAAVAAPKVKAEEVKAEEKTVFAPVKAEGGRILATPAAKRIAKEKGIALSQMANGGIIKARDVEAFKCGASATPLAKRIAEQQGIDLNGVAGSGYNGKIRKGDLNIAPKTADAGETGDELVALSGMRKTIAKRMLESHTDIPPVTLNTTADVTALAALRKQINDSFEGVKISFNDMVVKACAVALGEHRNINASYTEQGILYKKAINIGIAVALDDGLIVPVLKNADALSLSAVSSGAKALAAKAREGRLLPDEYTGGTFTVSNLGMFGIESFTPIINEPEACILGVCRIRDELVMDDKGGISSHKKMGLSLTFDHRCVDGATGAKFLSRICELLEKPVGMLI